MMTMSAPRPVKTPPTEVASRQPCAVVSKLRRRGALRREAGRENPAVPVAGDDVPAIARQFVGEILRIADAEDLRRGIVPETPGREGDRGQQRLQVARRQVDDEAPDLAAAQGGQFGGDYCDVPAHCEAGPRVELAETELREADEIAPQEG